MQGFPCHSHRACCCASGKARHANTPPHTPYFIWQHSWHELINRGCKVEWAAHVGHARTCWLARQSLSTWKEKKNHEIDVISNIQLKIALHELVNLRRISTKDEQPRIWKMWGRVKAGKGYYPLLKGSWEDRTLELTKEKIDLIRWRSLRRNYDETTITFLDNQIWQPRELD